MSDDVIANSIEQNGQSVLKKHKMKLIPLVLLIFCMVSGGYFGIEDMVSSSGPGLTILILLLFPFLWSIPQALIAAELGSAIPDEGGYYIWVQRAFGEFWGFQVGWWRTLSCYVDTSVYIVLSCGYIEFFLDMSGTTEFLLKTAMVLFFTWINYRGIEEVSRITTILMVFVLTTLVIFVVLGAVNWQYNPVSPFIPEGQNVFQSLGLGIAIGIWIYSGYESMGTMSGELENPQIIPKATLISVPIVVAVYVLPIVFGLASYGSYAEWSADSGVNFVSIIAAFGIPALTFVFVLGAVACNLSLFNAYLASGSRGYFVMAEDRLMPKFLCKVNKKYGTPHIAIFSMAIVNLILVNYDFATLIVIDVVLFMFAYLIWFFAAIALRVKEPDLERPFKIPFGIKGMVVMTIAPAIICFTALFTNGLSYLIGGCLALLTGPIFYCIFKLMYGGLDNVKKLGKKEIKNTVILSGLIIICIAIGFYMFSIISNDAKTNFNSIYEDTLHENYSVVKSSYVPSEDSFMFELEDKTNAEAETVVWFYRDILSSEGELSGDVYLYGEYADESEFAEAAFNVFNNLKDAELSYMDIYSDDYEFYAEYGENYLNAKDIYEYLVEEE